MKKNLIALMFVPVLSFASLVSKKAPVFKLNDMNNKEVSLEDYKGKYTVLEWTNHGCPFVKKHYNSKNMQKTQKIIRETGAAWLSIISSAKGKQGHSSAAEALADYKSKGSNATTVLIDEQGVVGRKYSAKTTPHMFIINPEGVVVYEGAIDSIASASENDISKAQNYILKAFENIKAGAKITTSKSKPYGCSVKY